MNKLLTENTSSKVKENRFAFLTLMLFTFVVYIGPQFYFPVLKPFRIAKVAAILSLGSILLNKGTRIQFDTETKLFLLFALVALLSVPFSVWRGGSLSYFFDQFSKSILLFILISSVINSVDLLKKMWLLIILFCSFLAVVSIRAYFAGDFIENTNRITGGLSPITSNPNDMALTLILIVPLSLSLLNTSQTRVQKILCLTYLVLSAAGIVCTFSRGGFLTLATVYGLFFLKMARKNGMKMLFLGMLVLVLFIFLIPEEYLYRITSITDFSKDATGSASSRVWLTKTGFRLLMERPLLGYGLGMNILAIKDASSTWHQIHNVYLQIGVEIGIAGMLIFIYLLVKLIKRMRFIQKAFNNLSVQPEKFYLAQGIEISLIAFAVAGIFHPVAYHFYFYYIAGFAVCLTRIILTNELKVRT